MGRGIALRVPVPSIFWDQAVESNQHVLWDGRVGVLVDKDAGRRVQGEDVTDPVCDSALANEGGNPLGDVDRLCMPVRRDSDSLGA